ncbi:hypothetical protein V8E55_008248 [Tylopilus felleus]
MRCTKNQKKILAFMVFGYICETAAVVTILGYFDAHSRVANEIPPGLYICAVVHGPSVFQPYLMRLPVVTYDGILCLLATWHGVRSWMSGSRLR